MDECRTMEEMGELKFHGICRSESGELFEFKAREKNLAENFAKSIQVGDLKVLSYKRPDSASDESDIIRIDIKRIK